MKIVVIGGTGLIGSKLVNKLKNKGHTVFAASRSTGVNSLTGEGLKEAFNGTDVVVDVANSPTFEEKEALNFFETAGRNIFAAEKAAKVPYHIALSVVGTDLMADQGYFKAKLKQENLIQSSGIPFTIVRATQFLEFLKRIAESGFDGNKIKMPKIALQPIAAEDVAEILYQVVFEKPVNGIIEIAGPDRYAISDIVDQYLKANNDKRQVVASDEATYFGAKLAENTLVPKGHARLGSTRFKEWYMSKSLSK